MEREYNEYVVSLEIVETSSERRQDWAWNREELAKTDGQGALSTKGITVVGFHESRHLLRSGVHSTHTVRVCGRKRRISLH